VLLGDALKVRKQVAPRGRQVERVRPSIGGVAPSLGEPAMLEVVDERDHGAAVEAKRDAESLLRLAFARGKVAEHAELPGMQVMLGEALREAPMGVGAQLREEKADALAELPGRGRVDSGGIAGHLPEYTVIRTV
jgi:hypothetical protein